MLPKRKTGTAAPRPKPKATAHGVDLVEQLQMQIEEERKKKLDKSKIDKDKTPLLQKSIAKKKPSPRTEAKPPIKSEKNKSNEKQGIPMDQIAPLPVDELQKTNEKKYVDSTTTTSTETESSPLYEKPKVLEPTAFTYFDRLANRDIMLSDSD